MATNLPDPQATSASDASSGEKPKGFGSRAALFMRQVIDELRKVVTPTRSELVNYTLVVLVFVIIMMAFVSVLDIFFGWGVSWIFGDGRSLFG